MADKEEPLTSISCESGYHSEIGSLSISSESEFGRQAQSSEEFATRDEEEYVNYMSKAYIPDKDGDTYLHILPLHEQHHGVMSDLIRLCPDSRYLDLQNNYGQTAIHFAALLGLKEQIGLLIEKNAKLELMNFEGNNIFHLCAKHNRVDSLLRIIEVCQQSYKMEVLSGLLKASNHEGYTPFFVAVLSQCKDICFWLKHHFKDIDVNYLDLKRGNSSLHEAVMMKDKAVDMVTFLLGECHLDVNVQNRQGVTPLHMASSIGDKKLCEVLLRYNACVEIKDVYDKLPANYAANEQIFELLSLPPS